MTLSELNRRVQALEILKLFAQCVEENKEYIADLNTLQLAVGKDSNDKSLYPYASDDYAKYKKAIGSEAPLGTPNLKLTGDFWEGFEAKADKDANVFITSTDSKTGKLKQMYDDDIFGLTDKSKADLKTVLLPNLLNKTRHELFR